MIAQLTGNVSLIQAERRYVILSVTGVGYRVYLPSTMLAQLQLDQSLTVFTYQHLREDASDLYGFTSLAALELFEQLISVSGVGPKVGLALLSAMPSQQLRLAIVQGDIAVLTACPGIGKRLAERLIVELKQALLSTGPDLANEMAVTTAQDVVTALQNFGYSSTEIRATLQHIDQRQPVADQIKAALGYLSQHGQR